MRLCVGDRVVVAADGWNVFNGAGRLYGLLYHSLLRDA